MVLLHRTPPWTTSLTLLIFRNVCTLHSLRASGIFVIHLVLDDELCFILRWTNSAPLPCGSCAPSFVSLGSCTSLGSVLVLALRVRLRCAPHLSVLCSGSWSCLGHPQPPWRTRHACTVGVNRDPPVCSRCPASMASVAERQPYVRWRRATISRRRGL